MKKKTLTNLYSKILEKLSANPDFVRDVKDYRTVDYHNWKDEDFLETMALVIFSTTLDWEIVKRKWKAIKIAFSNFDVGDIASYTEKDIKKLLKTPDIIPNRPKIRGIIQNAKEMREVIREYGSFTNYICFYPYDLKQDLIDKFKFIGEKTVLDFMKEMGFPVIKDDKHIRRLFYRLGFIPSEDVEQEEILKIGKVMAQTVNERACVVDYVLWTFGREICSKKPRCETCNITALCQFYLTIPSSP